MDGIRMVDLQGQYLAIKDEINAAIQSILDATQFIKGKPLTHFENDLCAYLGCNHAVGVGNGTDALQIAFMALGIQPGDEIITSPFTFIATAEAAALMGAVPVFADIDPQTYNIDPAQIEPLITPKTKAIVPVHLFGQSADMDPILEIAKRHNIPVIEDCAQAIGATYKGKKIGYFAEYGTLSFFPSKNLGAFGDGGAILSNDEELLGQARLIANHGSKKKYHNEIVGINSRLDSLQAAILQVKLKYLDQYIAARQEAAQRYDTLFADHPMITTPYTAPECNHVFHQYTIRVPKRDALSAFLKERNVPHAIYYPVPLHKLPVFAESMKDVHLPETDRAAAEVISLPMHTELTEEQQVYITTTIKEFLETETVTLTS